MGIIHADIMLKNPREMGLNPMRVSALVDSGAKYLCIPSHVSNQLKLQPLEDREVTLADGSTRMVPYVGPIELSFKGRRGFAGAMVLGDEVLLGAIPMKDMDIVINMQDETLVPNPRNPNIPAGIAKGVRLAKQHTETKGD